MCVLGPGDHSTLIYEVGVGGSCLLKGLRKWEQKRLPPSNKEHLRGLRSAEGSLGVPEGGTGDIGQQALSRSLLFRAGISFVLKLECP